MAIIVIEKCAKNHKTAERIIADVRRVAKVSQERVAILIKSILLAKAVFLVINLSIRLPIVGAKRCPFSALPLDFLPSLLKGFHCRTSLSFLFNPADRESNEFPISSECSKNCHPWR